MISVEQYRSVTGLFNCVKQKGKSAQSNRGMEMLRLLFWHVLGVVHRIGPILPLLLWLADEGAVGHLHTNLVYWAIAT